LQGKNVESDQVRHIQRDLWAKLTQSTRLQSNDKIAKALGTVDKAKAAETREDVKMQRITKHTNSWLVIM